MRLTQNLICIIVALMIAGCATQAGYEKILDTWLGHAEGELISSWGVPDSVYDAGSKKYLTYQNSRQMTLPASYTSNVYGNTIYTRSYGGNTINLRCKTTFTVDRGIIVDWSFRGNDCIG